MQNFISNKISFRVCIQSILLPKLWDVDAALFGKGINWYFWVSWYNYIQWDNFKEFLHKPEFPQCHWLAHYQEDGRYGIILLVQSYP